MMSRTVPLVLVFTTALCAAARASDISVDVLSAYVWRGQVLNDEAVVQPAVTAETPFGLSLNAWANVDLTGLNDQSGDINEVDLLVSYALPLGEEAPVSVEIGAVTFIFPLEGDYVDETTGETLAKDADTVEAFLTIEGNCILAPSLSVNYDVDEVDGWYLSAGIGHEMQLRERLALEAAASIAYATGNYNDYYFGVDDGAMNDGNLSLGATFAATEAVSVGARVAYSMFLDSDIEDGADTFYHGDNLFYGGVNLTYSF